MPARTAVCVAVLGVACGPRISDTTGSAGASGSSSDGGTDSGQEPEEGTETTGAEDACVEQIRAGAFGAGSPQVEDDWIYWSTIGGAVERQRVDAPATESAEVLLATTENYVDLLAHGDVVYMTLADRVSVFSVVSGQSTTLAEGQNNPFSPVLVGDHLYWINYGAGILAGALMRLPLADPTVAPQTVLDGLGFPTGAVADASGVFVLAKQVASHTGGVLLHVGPDEVTRPLVTGLSDPSSVAQTTDQVVWVEQNIAGDDGLVRAIAKTGGLPATLATIPEGLVVTVAADDRDVYYGVFDDGGSRVVRYDWASGTTQTVAQQPASTVVDIALSADFAFVTTAWAPDDPDAGTPAVTRVCR